jgi:hypothetical protein
MAIGDWKTALTTVLSEISGIEQVHAYDDLPAKIIVSPTLIWLPVSGSQLYGLSSPAVAIHRVQVTLYLSVALLPEGVGSAVPFIELVRDELAANIQLDGTVTYILPPVDAPFYEGPAVLNYNGAQALTGINFYFDVKEVENITVSA